MFHRRARRRRRTFVVNVLTPESLTESKNTCSDTTKQHKFLLVSSTVNRRIHLRKHDSTQENTSVDALTNVKSTRTFNGAIVQIIYLFEIKQKHIKIVLNNVKIEKMRQRGTRFYTACL